MNIEHPIGCEQYKIDQNEQGQKNGLRFWIRAAEVPILMSFLGRLGTNIQNP